MFVGLKVCVSAVIGCVGLTERVVGWLIGGLVDWLVGWLNGCLVGLLQSAPSQTK
jgi:hypothetical protein